MKIHGKIQKKISEEYEKKGYKVFVEASVRKNNEKGFYIVDVLAKKNDENIAIEIGRVGNIKKISDLKNSGYTVRIISFHFKDSESGKYFCICGHEWFPLKEKPKACPRCKQYLYYE